MNARHITALCILGALSASLGYFVGRRPNSSETVEQSGSFAEGGARQTTVMLRGGRAVPNRSRGNGGVRSARDSRRSSVAPTASESFDESLGEILRISDAVSRREALQRLAASIGSVPSPQSELEKLRLGMNPSDYEAVLPIAVRAWATESDFESVVTWIDTNASSFDPLTTAKLERASTESLVASDPESAASWLTQRSTDGSIAGHLEHVVERWATVAPNAAGEWLGALPQGGQNDLAIEAFARVVAHDDPYSAAQWAMQILDPIRREHALGDTITTWSKLDPAAAQQFRSESATGGQ